MFKHLKRAFCVLLVIILCLFSGSPAAIAQERPALEPAFSVVTLSSYSYNTLAFLQWLFRRTKDNRSRPARTVSAGRRGNCSEITRSFVGFVPPAETPSAKDGASSPSIEVKSFLGLTTAASPALWFHVPSLPDSVERLEFMVQDERNTDLMDQPVTIPLTGAPGVYRFDWGTTGVPLELNQAYHWYLSIICNPERPSRNPSIDAWIERVELTPADARALASATEREKIDRYIEAGIWHDAFTQLARLRCQQPHDQSLTADWTALLSSIGVSNQMAIAPITQCPEIR